MKDIINKIQKWQTFSVVVLISLVMVYNTIKISSELKPKLEKKFKGPPVVLQDLKLNGKYSSRLLVRRMWEKTKLTNTTDSSKRISANSNNMMENYPIGKYIKNLPLEYLSTLQTLSNEVLHWSRGAEEETVTYLEEPLDRCNPGFYKLPKMKICKKMDNCGNIMSRLTEKKPLELQLNKKIFSAKLDKYDVVYKLSDRNISLPKYANRVLKGIEYVMELQPNPYMIQVVGSCIRPKTSSYLVTEGSFKYGSLKELQKKTTTFYHLSPRTRFRFAIQIVAVFDFLQNNGDLPRVLCDMHGDKQALGQFLITDNGQVIVNDLEDVPEVDPVTGIQCKPEASDHMKNLLFNPPEQRFTTEEYYSKTHIKTVNEKSDIFKIVGINNLLLVPENRKQTALEKQISDLLNPLHIKCTDDKPENRPNIREVLIEYIKVYKNIFEK